MHIRTTFIITAALAFSFVKAQVTLSHCINAQFVPDDSAFISSMATYHDTSNQFLTSGFNQGDTVPDFNLPDTAYHNVKLSGILSEGKPVILVSVSYSCPASRESMSIVLPNLIAQFGNTVNFVLVYVMEAHPVYPDWSPYFDTVNTSTQNFTDSVLISQERRYFQRQHFAKVLNQQFHPCARIVLDDYNNDYWNTFGPSPNNAYLIKPDGQIFRKYGWFVQHQNMIIHDVDQLIAILSVNEPIAPVVMNMSPVPANDVLNVTTEFVQEWTLELVDETGRIVRHIEHISSAMYQLDCSGLRRGMYFVSVSDGTRAAHCPIIAGN